MSKPEHSKGTEMAAKVRAKTNHLSAADRQQYMAKALERIYKAGGEQEKARADRH